MFPPGPSASHHRPLPFRSSIFGLIVFDPYWWAADDSDLTAMPPPPLPSIEPSPPIGGVQLDVEPRRALVYVDGFYAGIVDDFSGYYRHLDAPAGPHRIVLVAPDYEPLVVDIVVNAGGTTTYRGAMNRTEDR